jgi:thioesterase domain-containing protein
MATQLHGSGHAVAPLVLIEPYLPGPVGQAQLARVSGEMVKALEIRDRVTTLPESAGRTAAVAELTEVLLGAGMSAGEASLVADAPIEVWHSLLKALADYQVRPYPGHVHLVVGTHVAGLPAGEPMPELDVDFPTYVERWRELALGGLTLHIADGDHMSMLAEPRVAGMAELLTSIRATGTEEN